MYLFIDTAMRDVSCIALIKNKKIFYKKLSSNPAKKSGDVLFGIDSLLKKNNTTAQKLHGIIVVVGPGQFSALRTGIAFANTFGFTLDIPVVGILKEEGAATDDLIHRSVALLHKKKRFSPVAPLYGKEPNITTPRTPIPLFTSPHPSLIIKKE